MTLDDATKQQQIEAAWAQHQAALAGPKLTRSERLALNGRGAEINAAWEQHRMFQNIRAGAARAKLRARLSSEQNHRCCQCGVRTNEAATQAAEATLEHIVPRSQGGPDTYANCVMTCAACNQTRGTAPLVTDDGEDG